MSINLSVGDGGPFGGVDVFLGVGRKKSAESFLWPGFRPWEVERGSKTATKTRKMTTRSHV